MKKNTRMRAHMMVLRPSRGLFSPTGSLRNTKPTEWQILHRVIC